MSSPPAQSTIRLDRVTLTRGDARLFDGLTLDLSERRIGLIGDNGAGKSSFLRLLNGLLKPDAGRVIVAGLDSVADRAALPAKVGFVFQNPDHQIVFPTVLEEVAFGLRERGRSAREADAAARETLARHGCADWADRAVQELSEGQKQRLCIIAIAAMEPAVLVMDEPFSSLDLPTRLSLTRLLERLPQQVVVASHDLDLLAGMDRLLWLRAGAIVADGPPQEVIAAYVLHARRLGDVAEAAA
ncbi:MAG TPA: ABC transporter ATP-binding protein [Beijerinckiaceae bacterium]|jgi:biotin transport system ATP-binding protein